MSSAMTHPEQGLLGLMEDLAGMLRTEVLPTHLALVQLIGKICENRTLKQVDLYSKYTCLAAVVGGDWIIVKEELRNATHFGVAAFYCSISAMLAVFTCRRSRSHEDLVSSLTELYNHISAGSEILNEQVVHAITTMGKQIEHANVAEARIANFNERVDNAITTMEKQDEQSKRAEESITTIIERADHVKTVMEKQVEQVNKAEATIANFDERVDNAITIMEKQEEQVKKAEESITTIIERADHIRTVMEKQVEQVIKAETSIANFKERVDNAITTMEKQEEQTKKAEESITTIIERADHVKTVMEKQVEQVIQDEVGIAKVIERADNVVNTLNKQINQTNIAETTPVTASNSPSEFTQDVVPVPGTKFRCKYGTLTIDDQYNFVFNGVSLEAKILALWMTLPGALHFRTNITNMDHDHLIKISNPTTLSNLHKYKHEYNNLEKLNFWGNLLIKPKTGQWTYIY